VCAAIALAGELSIAGALAAGEFSKAHQRLARGARQTAPVSRAPPALK
jgi:hydroxymethylglutaryl-CoA reductase (NADPH)